MRLSWNYWSLNHASTTFLSFCCLFVFIIWYIYNQLIASFWNRGNLKPRWYCSIRNSSPFSASSWWWSCHEPITADSMDQGIRLLLNLTSFQYIYICFQRRHSVLILCRFRVDIFRRGTIVTPSLRRDASVVVNVVLETLSFNCSLFLFSF